MLLYMTSIRTNSTTKLQPWDGTVIAEIDCIKYYLMEEHGCGWDAFQIEQLC